MADKKSSSDGGETGYTIMWKVLFLVLVIMIIGGTYIGQGISQRANDFFNQRAENSDVKLSFFSALFPNGTLAVGKTTMNKGELIVRNEPAGVIIGKQPARERGTILAGPVEKYDRTWWRMDYKNSPDGWVDGKGLTAHTFFFSLLNIVPITLGLLRPLFVFLSIVLIILIFIVFLKNYDLRKLNEKKEKMAAGQNQSVDETTVEAVADETDADILAAALPTGNDAPRTENVNDKRWTHIQSLINSHSVNDWKQAIIEADIILFEMLEKMGYKGESIGDKLKKVERSDFLTVESAWEAHKIRNRVAHKGSDYILSRDEAERAIKLYEEVFREFYFI
ncbi:MAG TPA: hypothetical protein P5328_01515 [Candidatus Paceibacterota bacterium]|nr:hypothetical protein [Candidatus Paceibacterota bacterium]HRZ34685.1 hypothetical protein [Candidatus Paceibacterota bacterium]